MPNSVQESFYAFLIRHPSFADGVSIAFVVVLNLGVPICVVAFAANVGFICAKTPPIWLKVGTTIFVALAILGVLTVRYSIHPIHF